MHAPIQLTRPDLRLLPSAALPAPKRQYVPLVFVPGTRVRLLTEARKMPCPSFSLPAGESCPYALYGPGSVCADCYAKKGNYLRYPATTRAQRARYKWVRRCLKTPEGTAELVATLTEAIRRTHNDYFRGHDAGDFFAPAYVRAWTRIVRQLPGVRFWFPTRSWRAITDQRLSEYTRREWTLALTELASQPNVSLRPSGLWVNAPAPRIAGLAAGTAVVDDGSHTCPASRQGNACLDCRTCFDRPDLEVGYPLH